MLIQTILFASLLVGVTENNSDYSLPEDSKEETPDLIYTTRQYYFDVQSGCLNNELCLDKVQFIITMDVGVTMQDEVKQAAFRSAKLKYLASGTQNGKWVIVDCNEYEHVYDSANKSVIINFEPGYSDNATVHPVSKCKFSGKLKEKGGMEGLLNFTLPSQKNIQVRFN